MKVYLEVYGCTANKSDAALLKGLVHNNPHYELIDDLQTADIVILITCTVIGTTEQRMCNRMRMLRQSGKPVIVTGCMASVQTEKIQSILPDAVLVPPNMIHTLFLQYEQNKSIDHVKEKSQVSKYFDSLIAPISIAEGCQFSCSYCITHLARGVLHSYPESTLFQDVKTAVQQGCKEIQLTAQDTASYGTDCGSSLCDLLELLHTIEGAYRIRVGMMNPRSVIRRVKDIATALNHPQIYHFIHLPVQSGDNAILQMMDRGYTIEEFVDIATRFRVTIPHMTLATDVIVGFPTETDEQFQTSIELLQRIQPDIVNITRFSARPNTRAKTMKGRIPTNIVKERSSYLSDVCQHLSLTKNQAYIGKQETILTLEQGKHHTIVGRTDSYKPVVVKEPVDLGQFVTVDIIDAKATHLVGMLK